MWIKKTPQEIAADDFGKSSVTGRWIVYGLLGVFLMIPVFFNFGRLAWRPGPFVRSMDDVMKSLPSMLFIYLVVVIFMQFFKIPILKKKVLICPKCEAAKNDDGDDSCPCGGHFVDIRTMKWVEDSKEI